MGSHISKVRSLVLDSWEAPTGRPLCGATARRAPSRRRRLPSGRRAVRRAGAAAARRAQCGVVVPRSRWRCARRRRRRADGPGARESRDGLRTPQAHELREFLPPARARCSRARRGGRRRRGGAGCRSAAVGAGEARGDDAQSPPPKMPRAACRRSRRTALRARGCAPRARRRSPRARQAHVCSPARTRTARGLEGDERKAMAAMRAGLRGVQDRRRAAVARSSSHNAPPGARRSARDAPPPRSLAGGRMLARRTRARQLTDNLARAAASRESA